MAYKKQNFTDGQVLTAEQLNHIEDGIVAVVESVGQCDSAIHVVVDWDEEADALMANYTPAEIYQRLQADGNSCSVYLHIHGEVHPLTTINENVAVFTDISLINNEVYENTLYSVSWSFGNDRLVHVKEEYIPLGCDNDAVLYTEQDLTKEQQAQARENIGAVSLEEVLNAIPNGEEVAY